MIGAAIAEIEASAVASLPAQLAAVNTARGFDGAPGNPALAESFTVQTWFQAEADVDAATFPVLAILWDRSSSGLLKPAAGVRDSEHQVELKYIYRGSVADLVTVARHMLYVPEAMLLWLDQFPLASRSPGATITQIAPPDGQGIEITHDIELARGDVLLWAATLALAIRTRDR